jgi:hypothetical protein
MLWTEERFGLDGIKEVTEELTPSKMKQVQILSKPMILDLT